MGFGVCVWVGVGVEVCWDVGVSVRRGWGLWWRAMGVVLGMGLLCEVNCMASRLVIAGCVSLWGVLEYLLVSFICRAV